MSPYRVMPPWRGWDGTRNVGSRAFAHNCAVGAGASLSTCPAFALRSRPRCSVLARPSKPHDFIGDVGHRLLKRIDDNLGRRRTIAVRRETKMVATSTSRKHVWQFAETPVFPLDPAQELLQLLYSLTNGRKRGNAPEAACYTSGKRKRWHLRSLPRSRAQEYPTRGPIFGSAA